MRALPCACMAHMVWRKRCRTDTCARVWGVEKAVAVAHMTAQEDSQSASGTAASVAWGATTVEKNASAVSAT